MSVRDIILQEIRRGRWRRTGDRDLLGRSTWYDIGLTRDEIQRCARVDPRMLDSLLVDLVQRGLVMHRRSQGRYVAAGKHRNHVAIAPDNRPGWRV